MRVTSNLFPETLQQQLADIQTKQLRYQTQSATGLKINAPSDNPGDYSVALNSTEDLSRMMGYVKASNDAQLKLTRNYDAMKTLHSLTSRAYELGQRGNNVYNSGDLKAWATELEEVVKQIGAVANKQFDGYYIFGGAENRPPVLDTTLGTAANSNTAAVDLVLNGTTTANVTSVDVNQNYSFQTGIVAGNAGGTATGFLNNGTTNVLSVVQSLYNSLNSGIPTTTAQIANLKSSLDLVSEQVGKTAAKLAALDTNASRISSDQQLSKNRVTELTEANMAEVLTQLQKTQFSYQAALQSGARILNISLLDYVR